MKVVGVCHSIMMMATEVKWSFATKVKWSNDQIKVVDGYQK